MDIWNGGNWKRETRIIFAISVFANAISEVLNETQLKRRRWWWRCPTRVSGIPYHRIYFSQSMAYSGGQLNSEFVNSNWTVIRNRTTIGRTLVVSCVCRSWISLLCTSATYWAPDCIALLLSRRLVTLFRVIKWMPVSYEDLSLARQSLLIPIQASLVVVLVRQLLLLCGPCNTG